MHILLRSISLPPVSLDANHASAGLGEILSPVSGIIFNILALKLSRGYIIPYTCMEYPSALGTEKCW